MKQKHLMLRLSLVQAACLFILLHCQFGYSAETLLPGGRLARLPAAIALSSGQLVLEEVVLRLKPKQCVALRRESTCYTTVKVRWQTPLKGDFCITSSARKKKHQCWSNASDGELEFKQALDEDVIVYLRMADTDQVIKKDVVKFAWVYEKTRRKQQSWRLF